MWLCERKLKVKIAHFRLPSAYEKRDCLSSLLCSKLCSAGGIMLKLCRTKMTFSPTAHKPVPIKNIPGQLGAWYKEITRPLTIPKCTGYESKVSSS